MLHFSIKQSSERRVYVQLYLYSQGWAHDPTCDSQQKRCPCQLTPAMSPLYWNGLWSSTGNRWMQPGERVPQQRKGLYIPIDVQRILYVPSQRPLHRCITVQIASIQGCKYIKQCIYLCKAFFMRGIHVLLISFTLREGKL